MLWLLCLIIIIALARWQFRRHGYCDRRRWWLGWVPAAIFLVPMILWWPPLSFLEKALTYCLMPVGLTWLTLITLVVIVREPRWLRVVLGLLVLLVTLGGNFWVRGDDEHDPPFLHAQVIGFGQIMGPAKEVQKPYNLEN